MAHCGAEIDLKMLTWLSMLRFFVRFPLALHPLHKIVSGFSFLLAGLAVELVFPGTHSGKYVGRGIEAAFAALLGVAT